jgi:hypothetical protein
VVSLGPRLRLSRPVLNPVCGLDCGCLVRLRFALRSLAVWRVCAIAPSFVSGWRAFSFVSLCKSYFYRDALTRVSGRAPLRSLPCPCGGPRHPPRTLGFSARRPPLISVIHPASGPCARAATRLPGWAAAHRDAAKERANQLVSSGLPFVPLSVETFGRLGAPALSLLRSLADHAVQAGGPGLSRGAFIPRELQELGIAMCQGYASLGRSGLHALMRVSGRGRRPIAWPLLSHG